MIINNHSDANIKAYLGTGSTQISGRGQTLESYTDTSFLLDFSLTLHCPYVEFPYWPQIVTTYSWTHTHSLLLLSTPNHRNLLPPSWWNLVDLHTQRNIGQASVFRSNSEWALLSKILWYHCPTTRLHILNWLTFLILTSSISELAPGHRFSHLPTNAKRL